MINNNNSIIVDGFIVPKAVYLNLTEVHGLTKLEAMYLILENV
jgi:hypothetical protein